MGDSYAGEIRMLAVSFAPRGWAMADGQVLRNDQNLRLFSLFGTTFGGDAGHFALPNLQGRMAMGFSRNYPLGKTGGEPTHTLTMDEMPQHSHHLVGVKTEGNNPSPPNNMFAATGNQIYHALDTAGQVKMNPKILSTVGGGAAHENMMPYLSIVFCVSLDGEMPPRSER